MAEDNQVDPITALLRQMVADNDAVNMRALLLLFSQIPPNLLNEVYQAHHGNIDRQLNILEHSLVTDEINEDIPKMLLIIGADLSTPILTLEQGGLLLELFHEGKNDMIEIVCAMPTVDINSANEDGNTLLHLAVQQHDLELVNILINKKPNVNFQNSRGNTPLHLAAWELNSIDLVHQQLEDIRAIVVVLLDKGSRINIRNNYERTPLDINNQILDNFP